MIAGLSALSWISHCAPVLHAAVGCLLSDTLAQAKTHGHTTGRRQSKEYMAWRDMMQRCYNPANPSYANYGGRGITVDAKWHDFAGFLADMGSAPDGLTLDRTNESKGYEKINCAWADWFVQGRHKRSNRRLDLSGITLSVADWSRKLGIKPETIHGRLRRGLPMHLVLSTQRIGNGPPLTKPRDRK